MNEIIAIHCESNWGDFMVIAILRFVIAILRFCNCNHILALFACVARKLVLFVTKTAHSWRLFFSCKAPTEFASWRFLECVCMQWCDNSSAAFVYISIDCERE